MREHEPYQVLLRLACSDMRMLAAKWQSLDKENILGHQVDAFIHTANMLILQSIEIKKRVTELMEQQAR